MISDLVITQDGKQFPNQGRGVRLFKDSCDTKERYRLVKGAIGWLAYYNGRRIVDTREMRLGAPDPGVLLDQIIRIRRWKLK